MNNVLTADEFLQKNYDGAVYALLGNKVESSISDILHTKLFELGRRKAKYVMIKLEAERLEEVISSGKLSGFNVTIPHKQNVLPLLGTVDPEARACGAVNTVVCRYGKLSGYNTDLYGIEKTFERMAYDPSGKRALVLGTGGAALTAVFFLAKKKCQISVVSRTRENLAEFSAKVKASCGADVESLLYEQVKDRFDLLVNCTPSGMYPKEDEQALDVQNYSFEAVFDLVYNPLRTRLLKNAKGKTSNGLYMLLMQAVGAQKLYFDAEFDPRDLERLYIELEAMLTFKRLRDKYDRKSIALCGFMGCGKSRLARLIGRAAGVPVYDVDAIIEETRGKSVREIFDEVGESGFRDIESETIRRLSNVEGVLSLGGGSVLREENVSKIKENSRLVFLDVPLEIIKKRLEGDTSRPLFSGDEEKLANLYEFRKKICRENADMTVFGNDSGALMRNIFENI